MQRGSNNIWFVAISLAIIVGLSILAWSLIAQNVSLLEALGWITGAFLPAFMFLLSELQKRSLRVFLFVNQVRSFFSAKTLTWNLSITFQGDDINMSTLDAVTAKLLSKADEKLSVKVKKINSFNRIVDISPGPTLDVNFNDSSGMLHSDGINFEQSSIQLLIKNYRLGYRQVSRALKREIIPLLEDVASVVKNADQRYTLTVDFDKSSNPFFGLFVTNMPPESVSNFYIRLNLSAVGQNTSVLVSDERISINTKSQRVLQDLALEFLAFQYSSEEYLKHA